jgi:dienelactone hydrolase
MKTSLRAMGALSLYIAALFAAASAFAQAPNPALAFNAAAFADKPYVLSNGIAGRPLRFESNSPLDYGPLLKGEFGPQVTLTAQLFLPANASSRVPAVILIPGSGNLAANYFAHAATLTSNGIAALAVDPFTGRGVVNTISNQDQFSFAASAYDALAAAKFLATMKEIDPARLGATGGSRGGTAVLFAASEPITRAVMGANGGLKAVVAGYPWCGVQFRSAKLAPGAAALILSGDRDDWVNPLQCQGQAHAMERAGQNVTMKIFPGAMHSFDREGVAQINFPDAVKALRLPVFYMDDQAQYYNPRTARVDPALTSAAINGYAVKNGLLDKGASIGSSGTQAQEYSTELLAFFKAQLLQ